MKLFSTQRSFRLLTIVPVPALGNASMGLLPVSSGGCYSRGDVGPSIDC